MTTLAAATEKTYKEIDKLLDSIVKEIEGRKKEDSSWKSLGNICLARALLQQTFNTLISKKTTPKTIEDYVYMLRSSTPPTRAGVSLPHNL